MKSEYVMWMFLFMWVTVLSLGIFEVATEVSEIKNSILQQANEAH